MRNFHIQGQLVARRPGLSHAVFAVLLIGRPQSTFAAEVTVVDVRPVAAVVESLEKQFGVPITYEDPPYLFADDVEDVTAKIARPGSSAKGNVVMAMKARELRFTNTAATMGGDLEAQTQTIQNALAANNKAYSPAIFELRRTDGRFHVYPKSVKNKQGSYVPHTSLMDVPISIEARDRSGREFISDLCNALARVNQVGLPWVPQFGSLRYWREQRTTLGGSGKTGRELLLQFFDLVESRNPDGGTKFSWSILRGVGETVGTLNIYSIETPRVVVANPPPQNRPLANPPQNATNPDGRPVPRR